MLERACFNFFFLKASFSFPGFSVAVCLSAGRALPIRGRCVPFTSAYATLNGNHDVFQIHIQTEFEGLIHCALVSANGSVKVGFVMKGWLNLFHISMPVPVLHSPRNPSWHLTPGSVDSSAARFTATG